MYYDFVFFDDWGLDVCVDGKDGVMWWVNDGVEIFDFEYVEV